MKLVYENEKGRIAMYGGGSNEFNITQISGLSIPVNDVATVRYPNAAGQVVTKSVPMERMITISADVRDENNKKISKAASVFSLPGVIYITSFGKTKKIKARCVSFEPNKRRGAYIPFTVQFCADNPYFSDVYETVTPIIRRNGRLSSPFVLGCMLSERMVKNSVINRGDTDIEPVFEITSNNGTACPEGITIKNFANGNTIVLNTDIKQGEVITVDVKTRKITSNVRGNLISCLNKDTSLSRFLINTGISVLEISAEGSDGTISACCKFNNNYVSAVV